VTDATKVVTKVAAHLVEISIPPLDLEPTVAEHYRQRILVEMKRVMTERIEQEIAAYGKAFMDDLVTLIAVPFAIRRDGRVIQGVGFASVLTDKPANTREVADKTVNR
jgi:hypothetical protein